MGTTTRRRNLASLPRRRSNADVVQENMNWKVYFVASARAYLAIQCSGILLGSLVYCFTGPSEADSLLGSLLYMPLYIIGGAIFTFMPTLIYAAILPAVIALVTRRNGHPSAVFGVASLLAVAFFAIGVRRFGWRPWYIDPFFVGMFLSTLPPAWLGADIVRKKIAQHAVHAIGADAPQHDG